MQTIKNLSQLLKHSGCQYAIYDLGRRIERISNAEFSMIEEARAPYPYPIKRQAQLAIAYWNELQQPWIWFLKFNLDERGLLNSTDLNHFLHYVIEAMGSRLNGKLSQEQQQQLAQNPYTFKPTEDKLALFNSLLKTELNQAPSSYLEHTQHYFQGKLGWENWQSIGLQGIGDMVTRLNKDGNERWIKQSLSFLPTQPLYALLGALEHVNISASLTQHLIEKLEDEQESSQPDLFLIAALLRGLAGASQEQLSQAITNTLSQTQLCHKEILIAIAGRCWNALQPPTTAELFLLRLAQTNDQILFNQLFSDLVMLPKLRMVLLPMLSQSPSPELEAALLTLQQHTRQG